MSEEFYENRTPRKFRNDVLETKMRSESMLFRLISFGRMVAFSCVIATSLVPSLCFADAVADAAKHAADLKNIKVAAAASGDKAGLPVRISATELPARKVHFLIFSLTRDPFSTPGLGPGAEANGRFLDGLGKAMIRMFPNDPNRIRVASVADFNQAQFESQVKLLTDVTSEDTIVCYMSTHGSYNNDGHHLYMNDGSAVLRKVLFKALKDKGARQTVFITDACANVPTGSAAPGFLGASVPPATVYAFCDLLFNFKGNLNINGARPPVLDPNKPGGDRTGQQGWYSISSGVDGGGMFTRAFMRVAVYEKSADWKEFFANLSVFTLDEGRRFMGPNSPLQTQNPALLDENGILIP